MTIYTRYSFNGAFLKTLVSSLFLLSISAKFSFGQDSSAIARIFTQPAEAVIKVDGEFVMYGKELKLDTGMHTVEAWIEGYEFTTKEFRVTKGDFKTVRVKLLPSEKYVKYKKKRMLYRTQKNTLKFLPLAAYTGYAAVSLNKLRILNNEANDNLEMATEAKSNYNNGFWLNDLEENRELYYQSKADYEKNIEDLNKKRTEFAVVTGGAAIVCFLSWKAALKLKKPIFKAESKMHQFTFTPLLMPNKNGIHLTYQF